MALCGGVKTIYWSSGIGRNLAINDGRIGLATGQTTLDVIFENMDQPFSIFSADRHDFGT